MTANNEWRRGSSTASVDWLKVDFRGSLDPVLLRLGGPEVEVYPERELMWKMCSKAVNNRQTHDVCSYIAILSFLGRMNVILFEAKIGRLVRKSKLVSLTLICCLMPLLN